MKRTMLIFFLAFISYSAWDKDVENMPELLMFEHVVIHGSTNFSDFTLEYRESICKPILISELDANEKLSLTIPAKEIKAESQLMRRDFLTMINADKHPDIQIYITKESIIQLMTRANSQHEVTIKMNNVQQTYVCESKIVNCHIGQRCFEGKLHMGLKDFGIMPPKKILGVIAVKNKVFISFKFILIEN